MKANRKYINSCLFKSFYSFPEERAYKKQVKRAESAKSLITVGLALDAGNRLRRIVWRRIRKRIGINSMLVLFGSQTTIRELLEFEVRMNNEPDLIKRCAEFC